MTSGRSLAESERHSVPLSAAALPTDCGDCEPECISESIQCFVAASDSLEQQREHYVMILVLEAFRVTLVDEHFMLCLVLK